MNLAAWWWDGTAWVKARIQTLCAAPSANGWQAGLPQVVVVYTLDSDKAGTMYCAYLYGPGQVPVFRTR